MQSIEDENRRYKYIGFDNPEVILEKSNAYTIINQIFFLVWYAFKAQANSDKIISSYYKNIKSSVVLINLENQVRTHLGKSISGWTKIIIQS